MPGRDGTGPYGTGAGQGRGRGPCGVNYPANSANYNEKAFLENTIMRLESELNMYKKRLADLQK